MDKLRAKVVNGRLVLDVPCELPDGTMLEFVVADDGDELDDVERDELHGELDRAWHDVKAGGTLVPAEAFIEGLRRRR